MATDKPRFTITLSEELYEKVNEYQHSKRFSTQTKAIVDLIERGAKSLGLINGNTLESSNVELIDSHSEITKKYRALDEHGKEVVNSVLSIEYKRCSSLSEKYAAYHTSRVDPVDVAARNGNKISREDAESGIISQEQDDLPR